LPPAHEKPERAGSLAEAAISAFPETFRRHRLSGMRKKLALFNYKTDDTSLIDSLPCACCA